MHSHIAKYDTNDLKCATLYETLETLRSLSPCRAVKVIYAQCISCERIELDPGSRDSTCSFAHSIGISMQLFSWRLHAWPSQVRGTPILTGLVGSQPWWRVNSDGRGVQSKACHSDFSPKLEFCYAVNVSFNMEYSMHMCKHLTLCEHYSNLLQVQCCHSQFCDSPALQFVTTTLHQNKVLFGFSREVV